MATRLFATPHSSAFNPSFEFASRTETLLRELMDENGVAVRPHRPVSPFSSRVGHYSRALARRVNAVRHALRHRRRT